MNKTCILTPANRSIDPAVFITKGNDSLLTLHLTTGQGEPINLREAGNLSVAIISARSGMNITPVFRIMPEGVLEFEFDAQQQELGIYGLRVSYEIASQDFADGREQVTWQASNLIEVVPTSTLALSSAQPINGYIAALKRGPIGPKGEKGDPGVPGKDGKTPYIKDGTWWIGDTNTEVNAEVKQDIFTTEEWLRMSKLTTHKAVVADVMIDDQAINTLQKFLDSKDTHPGLQRNQVVGARKTASQYTYEWYYIKDITKYGLNFIINVRASYTSGQCALYWKQDGEWQSVIAAKEREDSRNHYATAHINNPQGEVVLMCRPIWDFGYEIHGMDIYSPYEENIAYPMGTWLGRNRLPNKGDTYICTNLGVKGERVLLAYDGHNWLTAWGAVVRGETTLEAKQAYAHAVLSLRDAIINPIT
ncbi:MAG: collagen-like protein [Porphyromonadaceae bacterium]|nr:collagen-like protein [Porphyromonadaceae bacterium]